MHNVEVLPEFEVSPSQQEIAFLQVILFSICKAALLPHDRPQLIPVL